MTAVPAAPIPRTRSRRRIIRRVLFLALLAMCAWFGWREYEFRAAVKEAQTLGWGWTYDNPIDAIRADWRAAFRKATWTDGKRDLFLLRTYDLVAHGDLVRQLAPRSLQVLIADELKDLSVLKSFSSLRELSLGGAMDQPTDESMVAQVITGGCEDLENIDAIIGHPALRTLHLADCTSLTSVDVLRKLPALRSVALSGCTGLKSIEALAALPALESLTLNRCTGITNFDVLAKLPALQYLDLAGCPGITNLDMLKAMPALRRIVLKRCAGLANVDALKYFPSLQNIDLASCPEVRNVDALKELKGLTKLTLHGCSLTPEGVKALRAALPAADIFEPVFNP